MMPYVRLAVVVCLSSWALATGASRAYDSPPVGGPGGGAFHDPCGGNDALVGLTYSAGKDLNSVTAVCQAMHGGVVDGASYALQMWGTEAEDFGTAPLPGILPIPVVTKFGDAGTIRCPAGMAVWRVYGSISAHRTLHQVRLTCRNPGTGATADTEWSAAMGGQGGVPGFADCGANGYASGIAGGYGVLIDRLGLICASYTPPAVSTPSPAQGSKPVIITGKQKGGQPQPATSRKPGLEVNNGKRSGGGGGASAATDTTIYDQPEGNDVAYLSAGDPVTIVRCNDNRWCQISKPRKGWVWGEDLDR